MGWKEGFGAFFDSVGKYADAYSEAKAREDEIFSWLMNNTYALGTLDTETLRACARALSRHPELFNWE
jgi:hypothetical protein